MEGHLFLGVENLCIFSSSRFHDDPMTLEIERQFMWGPALLISPVLEEVRNRAILLLFLITCVVMLYLLSVCLNCLLINQFIIS